MIVPRRLRNALASPTEEYPVIARCDTANRSERQIERALELRAVERGTRPDEQLVFLAAGRGRDDVRYTGN